MDLIKISVMVATASTALKDQKSMSCGLVESASVNSITDFTPPKANEIDVSTFKKKEDFINNFICHLIFYAVFCISLILHILIDLGLGLFIKNKVLQLLELGRNEVFVKRPAIA